MSSYTFCHFAVNAVDDPPQATSDEQALVQPADDSKDISRAPSSTKLTDAMTGILADDSSHVDLHASAVVSAPVDLRSSANTSTSWTLPSELTFHVLLEIARTRCYHDEDDPENEPELLCWKIAHDISNARLTCREFAVIGLEVLVHIAGSLHADYQALQMPMQTRTLTELAGLLRNRKLASMITTLEIIAIPVYDEADLRNEMLRVLDEQRPGWKEDVRQVQVDRILKQYTQRRSAQERFIDAIRPPAEPDLLSQVVQALPRLSRYTIQIPRFWDLEEPYAQSLSTEKYNGMFNILEALATTLPAAIEQINITTDDLCPQRDLPSRIVGELDRIPVSAPQTILPLAQIKTLSLAFYGQVFEQEELSAHLGGKWAKALSSATCLEILRIAFLYGDQQDWFPPDFHEQLLVKQYWPELKSFILDTAHVRSGVVGDFLFRHRATVTTVDIIGICSSETELMRLAHRIRDHMTLQDCYFSVDPVDDPTPDPELREIVQRYTGVDGNVLGEILTDDQLDVVQDWIMGREPEPYHDEPNE